jgi:hypothetical protein
MLAWPRSVEVATDVDRTYASVPADDVANSAEAFTGYAMS